MNRFPGFQLRSFLGRKKSPRRSPIPTPTILNSPPNDTLTPDHTPAIPSLTLKNTSSTTPDYTPTTPYYTPTTSSVDTPHTLPVPPITLDDTPAISSSITLALKSTFSTTPDYTPTTPYYTPTTSSVNTPHTLPVPPIMPSGSEGEKMQQVPFEPNKSKLFDIIDKFRELGIHEDISLPQLVVVGDQSSGKSSLLEALTRLPFPVASTLCTRFATQILFRRTAPGEVDRIRVTIIPSEESEDKRKAALREFGYDVESLSPESFTNILADATETMGLPKPGVSLATGARFSDDVLKIELSGPNHNHFSVVDVPGLFQAATTYQTVEDGQKVEALAKRYINESRTIILAVASSLNETANQKVFTLAKDEDADPRGIRTLGVLTKPDALQKGDEARVIEVARNKVTVLNHGWFVVRNRSTQEITDGVTLEQRNIKEKEFFSSNPWRTLPEDRVGIVALEKFLRTLLDEHVKNEFPNLLKEMNGMIEAAEREFELLGPARETPDEQRRILLKLAVGYQSISTNAILGNYRDEFFDKVEPSKLRTQVAFLNDEFNTSIIKQGHKKNFEDPSLRATIDAIKDKTSIYNIIQQFYSNSRGSELPGMVNPAVVQNLFKWQSESWERIAKDHVQSMKEITNAFIGALLIYVCPNEDLEPRIRARLTSLIEEAYTRADEELASILKSERYGVLLTLDDSYAERLQESRRDRTLLSLKALKLGNNDDSVNKQLILNAVSLSNEIQSVNDIHDILRSYYSVARKRFIDNVAVQVVERHFLSREEGGPASCFSPQWVGSLSVDELELIAGEDRIVSNRRAVLLEKLEKWRYAKKFAGGVW